MDAPSPWPEPVYRTRSRGSLSILPQEPPAFLGNAIESALVQSSPAIHPFKASRNKEFVPVCNYNKLAQWHSQVGSSRRALQCLKKAADICEASSDECGRLLKAKTWLNSASVCAQTQPKLAMAQTKKARDELEALVEDLKAKSAGSSKTARDVFEEVVITLCFSLHAMAVLLTHQDQEEDGTDPVDEAIFLYIYAEEICKDNLGSNHACFRFLKLAKSHCEKSLATDEPPAADDSFEKTLFVAYSDDEIEANEGQSKESKRFSKQASSQELAQLLAGRSRKTVASASASTKKGRKAKFDDDETTSRAVMGMPIMRFQLNTQRPSTAPTRAERAKSMALLKHLDLEHSGGGDAEPSGEEGQLQNREPQALKSALKNTAETTVSSPPPSPLRRKRRAASHGAGHGHEEHGTHRHGHGTLMEGHMRDPFQDFIQGLAMRTADLKSEMLRSDDYVKDTMKDFRSRSRLMRLNEDGMSREVLEDLRRIMKSQLGKSHDPGSTFKAPADVKGKSPPVVWKRSVKEVRQYIEQWLREIMKSNPEDLKAYIDFVENPGNKQRIDQETLRLMKTIAKQKHHHGGIRPTMVRELKELRTRY